MDRLIGRYQMLARAVPLKSETPLAVVREQIDEQSRQLREFRRDPPQRLEGVVERSMAQGPWRRHQSTAEVAQAPRAGAPGLPLTVISPRWEPTPLQQPDTPRRTPTPPPRPATRLTRTPCRPSVTWMTVWANAWQRSRRCRWARAGGIFTVLVLAMGIATACSGEGDEVGSVIEVTPNVSSPETQEAPARPLAIAAPPGSARSGQIAFVSRRDGNSEIYVMNADGTRQTRLTNNPARESDPAWSPDGTKIAFSSNRDGNDEIYVMNPDGSGQTRLTDNSDLDRVPAWSPNGAKIAFVSGRDNNSEIYVMNADGTGQTRLTNNPAFDSDPAWSPDGAKIAFMSSRDGNDEIYVMTADGTGRTRLTTNEATDSSPAWLPDSSAIETPQPPLATRPPVASTVSGHIAFFSSRDGNREIYVMTVDGTGQTRLNNNPAFDVAPTWSPDGAKIAFRSDRDGNDEIYVMNADGSSETRLTDNPAQDSDPAWSPIARKIAFSSSRDGNWEVYVMNADGTGQTRLTNNEAWDSGPAWSPFIR